MGRKRSPGLRQRDGVWHINGKSIKGYGRIYESCGTSSLEEAERYLARRLDAIRQATVYGVRPRRKFKEAAAKFLNETTRKDTETIAYHLLDLAPYINNLPLERVHDDTLTPFVAAMRRRGNKAKTINNKLELVRRILNLAARKWRDVETGLTWMVTAPLITMLQVDDARPPHPLSWAEQGLLFPLLPDHIGPMALFSVNTGARDEEVCALLWAWEQPVRELDASVFVVPGVLTKNGRPRVLMLNTIAQSVIEAQRGKHVDVVFPYKGRRSRFEVEQPPRVGTMNNTGWQTARRKAATAYAEKLGEPCPPGFATLHVHDLRHAFSRRLRAAGVAEDTRADLLGHTRGDNITAHYSIAELRELHDAVQRIVVARGSVPATMLKVA